MKKVRIPSTFSTFNHSRSMMAIPDVSTIQPSSSTSGKTTSMSDTAAEEAFSKANALYLDEEYQEALGLYDEAVKLSGNTNFKYLVKRAMVYYQVEDFQRCIGDLDVALGCTDGLCGNDGVGKAFKRKGMALYQLEKRAESLACFRSAERYGINVADWLKKFSQEEVAQIKPTQEAIPQPSTMAKKVTPVATDNPSANACDVKKTKWEWYQSDDYITLNIYIKKADPAKVTLDMSQDEVSVDVPLQGNSTYSLSLFLAHAIDPSGSTFECLSTKIEIRLKKSMKGLHWKSIEKTDEDIASVPTKVTTQSTTTTSDSQAPSYPTSGKKKINWDALEKEMKEEEESENKTGDAALNALFQNIYKNADENTRKAMNKSFSESGGTCLSTNWSEVGKGKVEITPPDGMVAKKWDA